MNPILGEKYFVPDVEGRVMPDGRLYLYGSWEKTGDCLGYCSNELHCFSTDNLQDWSYHGLIYTVEDLPAPHDVNLYAPDAVYKDGKYYLFMCDSTGREFVAVADSPIGPFSKAEEIIATKGDGVGTIDPCLLVDDDGQAYYYWGQFHLRGGKLAEDMKTVIPKTIDKYLITEWEHGFHEGSSIRKRNGKYYMLYTDISRGRATTMSYAMADSPLGPYKKCGVVIDNTYCDPGTWNDHGSFVEFKGEWYVIYHRSSHNGSGHRRACIEKIEFDENGLIKEVVQTSQGAAKPFQSTESIPARCACRVMGKCYVQSINGKEILQSKSGGHWRTKDWAEYRYIDFGNGEFAKFNVVVKGKGSIVSKIESNVTIAEVVFDTEEYKTVEANVIQQANGVHCVWLFLEGDFELLNFSFKK